MKESISENIEEDENKNQENDFELLIAQEEDDENFVFESLEVTPPQNPFSSSFQGCPLFILFIYLISSSINCFFLKKIMNLIESNNDWTALETKLKDIFSFISFHYVSQELTSFEMEYFNLICNCIILMSKHPKINFENQIGHCLNFLYEMIKQYPHQVLNIFPTCLNQLRSV